MEPAGRRSLLDTVGIEGCRHGSWAIVEADIAGSVVPGPANSIGLGSGRFPAEKSKMIGYLDYFVWFVRW